MSQFFNEKENGNAILYAATDETYNNIKLQQVQIRAANLFNAQAIHTSLNDTVRMLAYFTITVYSIVL